ncbi:MAG: response regulator [Bacteroidota bacterium]|nr:response regulator [Flavisolibacter sp.]MBD0353255.1 response regulator [Flavisolibacter sp.]MBD0366424.1 response regulator [Flavisolibacter sp.]MBD0376164.1 response regulator [Flavisolibacter sp.]MDQ3846240.1 response regulator [Bacteroidota bacterium]
MNNEGKRQHFILWADDDNDDFEIFREVLLHINYKYSIVEVANGKEVFDYLHDKAADAYPCLIVLDMNMPVLSGRDTLAMLKKHSNYKSIPVIVFTTSNSELDKAFCRRYNTRMITKPPDYKQLQEVLPKLLSACNQAHGGKSA